MPAAKIDHVIVCAARKIAAGNPTTLNFMELRTLGLRFHESWERELEMQVDATTHHNPGLAMQFFIDGRGPNKGYSGAISCLRGYIGDPAAPRLTKEDCDALEAAWKEIANQVSNRCHEKESTFEFVEYTKILGIWFHAGSGKRCQPVDEHGNPWDDATFEKFLQELETHAEAV
jgi:hypothetical protein